MEVPRLDDNVKEQLKHKGMDPKFGAEKNMFRIQEQLLEVGGPLSCLLANLVNPEVEVDREAIIQVVQRALVLLGSASHSISLERRKVAWARINLDLKSLALEDYSDRQNQLFGPGFLEKASKRLELDKAFAKVTAPPLNPKKRNRSEEHEDLRCFLSRGAPSQYGSRGQKRPQKKLYHNQPSKFPQPARHSNKSSHPAKKHRKH